jgi:diadenosine tetraphosphatase ApaH/serine/threonine PP2A family protein phosphatase
MKVALLSDIHSNLEAFQAVQASIAAYQAEEIIFLGDIIGYGADPNECIALLRNLAGCSIAGNHDFAAVEKTDIENFNPLAREAIVWTQKKLDRENARFLSSLPLHAARHGFYCVHSTPMHPQLWDYIVSLADAGVSFDNFTGPLCFVGHSHHPAIFIEDSSGKRSTAASSAVTLKNDYRYIINIGSVGQPRDGNPLASYGLYDTEIKKYCLIRVAYDIAAAQQKIVDAGLPPFLAARLEIGR